MNRQWARRTFLQLTGVATVPLAGCSTLGLGENSQPLTELYGNNSITYEHDQLQLSGPEHTVALGDRLKFTVTNTSTTSVALGCHIPSTLHQRVDGHWRDVIWTTARGIPNCATMLPAGKSRTKRVTVERFALETETDTVKYDLTLGLYRIVLLGTDPFLAVDFRVQSS